MQEMLDAGADPQIILEASKEAMTAVGARYEAKEYFLPELIIAGDMLKEIGDMVKPKLPVPGRRQGPAARSVSAPWPATSTTSARTSSRFMLDVNNFEVHDLGVDVPAEASSRRSREIRPDVVGLSGFLTMAFDQMKRTVEAIKEAGLRDQVKIMIGGAIMDANAAQYIGADAYGADASAAVKLAKGWLA